MKQTDFDRFAELLNAWSEIHGKALSTGAIALWWQTLLRYDIDQIEGAFADIVRDPDRGQFMPKPADLVRMLDGTTTDRAAIAWGKVLDAARRVGAYTDVVFDDAAIHAAVEDCGGWPKLCRTSLDDLGYLQHQFSQSYRAYLGRAGFEYPKALTGDANAHNRRTGQDLQPPALIGNTDLAALVYAQGGEGKTAITSPSAMLATATRHLRPVKESA